MPTSQTLGRVQTFKVLHELKKARSEIPYSYNKVSLMF